MELWNFDVSTAALPLAWPLLMEPLPRWEVATNCQSMPYPSMSTLDVATAVQNGYRLACPLLCPEQVFAVMASCWRDREQRPSFAQLHAILTDMQADDLDVFDIEREVRALAARPQESSLLNFNEQHRTLAANHTSHHGEQVTATEATLVDDFEQAPSNGIDKSPHRKRMNDLLNNGAGLPKSSARSQRPTARQVLNVAVQNNHLQRKKVVEHRDYVRLTLL